ncbi:hypothetical protein [Brevibacillus choshinensis]|uniref:Uncharacterized protein n=1 Tax=Brevibacillus choshinensis TaxID=54911 RepID=A0ABX7FJZ0_BRECH|nr:hypothetical protein [Brevibacillus choshinensis]QRG65954.1 hypothetical protein JNE38_20565 [Brevibacillus choshinensis]
MKILGYSTAFEGYLEVDKELDDDSFELLKGLARTRRIKRDPQILEQLGYGTAESLGIDGELYVEPAGKTNDYCPSIINQNEPPGRQPGIFLQWIPTEDRKRIIWDRGIKFYNADEWIMYLIDNILSPRGYIVNGIVNAQGEDEEDKWRIEVKENTVDIIEGFSELQPVPNFDKWLEDHYAKLQYAIISHCLSKYIKKRRIKK